MQSPAGKSPCGGVCPEVGQFLGRKAAADPGPEVLRVLIPVLIGQAIGLVSARSQGETCRVNPRLQEDVIGTHLYLDRRKQLNYRRVSDNPAEHPDEIPGSEPLPFEQRPREVDSDWAATRG